jgi:hypothetical protein
MIVDAVSSSRCGRLPRLARLALLAVAACFAVGVHAQTNPTRDLPKDAKTGYLTHVVENVFTLDGQRIALAPGGIVRGTNNLILVPNAVPRESLVLYAKDPAGNLSRAWVLTKDEAAKANVGGRFPWQTSPETGTPIGQVLPNAPTQPQRGAAPGFMNTGPNPSGATSSGTTQ